MKPFKSIWKRRGRYGWLIVEIIVASAIAFFVLDPIVVGVYDSHRNFNYNGDRLVMVQLTRLDPHNPAYDEARAQDLQAIESDIMQVIPRFAALDEVEKAIPMPHRGFGGGEDSYDSVILPDSTEITSFKATFIPGTEFFTTMGFRAAEDIPGNPTIEEMNNMWVDFYNEMICTRTMARLLHGNEYTAMEASRQQQGTEADNWLSNRNSVLNIVGIIEDTRAWGDRPYPLIRFYADPLSHSIQYNSHNTYEILLRLKAGESAKSLAHRINRDPELHNLARLGILEFKEAIPYTELSGEDSFLSPKERYRNVLMVFFALNIFLGVFGTFWLLTRKRTEEAGIMRAFGATPLRVRMMLYVEGLIIALGSSLIGCGIYIYYLSKNPEQFEYGLNSHLIDKDMNQLPAELHTWVGDFWMHSAIVTGVVCAIMLIVVLAGIAIPAWKLSRINPVEALADE
ncbi:MAG: FtsX-like permease family protein [Muribaculaceae bacterium]|nr:FtsX-like permease family protein [Muribaculaceae bacterium]